MSRRRLAQQTLALSVAAPQVVAHRLQRLAAAGAQPSARDRREFAMMGTEKVAAFYESWAAMGWAALRAQQQLWSTLWLSPFTGGARWPSQAALMQHATRVMSQGLAPVHRRAAANAKRLGRPARR